MTSKVSPSQLVASTARLLGYRFEPFTSSHGVVLSYAIMSPNNIVIREVICGPDMPAPIHLACPSVIRHIYDNYGIYFP